MIKIPSRSIWNILLIVLLVLLLAGFQTTFWFQVFGSFPPPLIWLNVIVFLALYRKFVPGIICTYICGFALSPFTAMPTGLLLLSFLILYSLLTLLKKRIFWSGSGYFWMAAAGSSLAFQIIQMLICWYFEPNSLSQLDIWDRLIQIITTPLPAVIVYSTMNWFDHITGYDPLPETGAPEV